MVFIILKDATAEYTIGLLLNTSRRISEAIEAGKNGQWGQVKLSRTFIEI